MPDIFPENSFVGIDIGTRWIKAVELRKSKGGFVVSKIARKEIVTPETDNPEERQKANISAVTALIKENKFSARRYVLGLPGHQIFVRKMRLPAASEDRLAKIIIYEARQQIPFPIDKIQMDYYVKPIPESQEVEVLLVGSKREIVADYIKFVKDAGINAKYLDVTPVALFNFHKYIDPELSQEATALINIGAATTDISIVRDGWLSFTRTAPVAGNDVTRNIAKTLNIDFAKAEQHKLKYGRVPLEYETALGIDDAGGSDEDQKISSAITTSLDRLVGEIRRTFDYYISQPDGVAINRVIISGGASQLENIDGYIGEKLAIPVILAKNQDNWVHFGEMKSQFEDDLSWATTATGLALRGAGKIPELIQIDFLPKELKDIREFEHKRLQIVIATILLLIVIFVGSMFGSDEIGIKQQKSKELNTKVKTLDSSYKKYSTLKDKIDKLSKIFEDLRLVVTKRDFWLDIIIDISKNAPGDIWFTHIQARDDYKMTIEGKSLSDGSVTVLLDYLNNKATFVEKDKNGKANVKAINITTGLDPRLDKTVSSFILEIECKQPKAYIPRDSASAAKPNTVTGGK